jgi:Arc/MetJ-type ribon-helix-helix transcriptional regulator
MKIITINIPDQFLDALEILVCLGFFPSRSQAMREAIKDLLEKDLQFNGDIVPEAFQKLKETQLRCLVR